MLRITREIVLAVNCCTVEGQTTAHYITDRLTGTGIKVTRLAHGVPVGGELDYLDEGIARARGAQGANGNLAQVNEPLAFTSASTLCPATMFLLSPELPLARGVSVMRICAK